MSIKLDRGGIFMARAISWQVRTFDSMAAAINIEFQILGQLNDVGGWDDWLKFEDHTVYGLFFFAKKDGSINETTVAQLAKSLGWRGDLFEVQDGPPPRTPVQITVGSEEYKGQQYYKVMWINPKDYTPQPQSATPEKVSTLNAQFGSLLRAAAAAAVAKQGEPMPQNQATPSLDNDTDESDLPF